MVTYTFNSAMDYNKKSHTFTSFADEMLFNRAIKEFSLINPKNKQIMHFTLHRNEDDYYYYKCGRHSFIIVKS